MPLGQPSSSRPAVQPRESTPPRPLMAQPVTPATARPAMATPAASRVSPLPSASGPVTTRSTLSSAQPPRDTVLRPALTPAARPTPTNFRHPTPLDRLQLQDEAKRNATTTAPRPQPSSPAISRQVPSSVSSREPSGETRPILRVSPLTSRPSHLTHFSATDEPSHPSQPISTPVSQPDLTPSLSGPLPTVDDGDARREPRFTAPPAAATPLIPGLSSPGLYVDEPRSVSKPKTGQLPPLRIDPIGDADEDDLPPFSAS